MFNFEGGEMGRRFCSMCRGAYHKVHTPDMYVILWRHPEGFGERRDDLRGGTYCDLV